MILQLQPVDLDAAVIGTGIDDGHTTDHDVVVTHLSSSLLLLYFLRSLMLSNTELIIL